jgi:hypothetical protein
MNVSFAQEKVLWHWVQALLSNFGCVFTTNTLAYFKKLYETKVLET